MQDVRQLTHRAQESFLWSKEITKPYGELDRVLSWAKTELIGDWRWQVDEVSSTSRPGKYLFCFDSDRDYFAFILQWS